MAFEIYWSARDLAGSPVGNHQFILIYVDPIFGLPPFSVLEEKDKRFVTLGAFSIGGNLEFQANEPSDVKSVRESIDTKKRGWFSDFDLEKNKVPSPLASDQKFAETLVKQALAFKVNIQSKKIKYTLVNKNCSAWVNMMFKIAGVTEHNRNSYGEFNGVDWGEEDLLDENLFV